MINLYCFSNFLNIDPWITCLLPIIYYTNVLKVINHIPLILRGVLLQRFEKSFPPLYNIAEFLINIQIFIIRR